MSPNGLVVCAIKIGKFIGAAMKSGLVSISFRTLPVPAVVELARRAGLAGIEWGGDVHVPHGDVKAAQDAGARTRAAGMEVAAYGSYYRLGMVSGNPPFEDVISSAMALGAPVIRVWAGIEGSARTDAAAFAGLVSDALRVAAMARSQGLRVGLEYHAGTLTDTRASTHKFLEQASHPALFSFWQPPVGASKDQCLDGLKDLVKTGKLGSIHVFHWWPDDATRLPLQSGAQFWKDYLALAAQAEGERFCCLEFVKGDDPEQLMEDAKTLNLWLKELT